MRKPTFEGPSQEIYGVTSALICFLNKNIWRPLAVFKKDLKSIGAPKIGYFCKAKGQPVVRRALPSDGRYSSTPGPTRLIFGWSSYHRIPFLSVQKTSYRRYLPAPGENVVVPIQGHLAHEKAPTPLGTPQDPSCSPTRALFLMSEVPL